MRWIAAGMLLFTWVANGTSSGPPSINAEARPPLAWVLKTVPSDRMQKKVISLAVSKRKVLGSLGEPDFIEFRQGHEVWWYRCVEGTFHFGFGPRPQWAGYSSSLLVYEIARKKALGR